jgi:hypothetical protein
METNPSFELLPMINKCAAKLLKRPPYLQKEIKYTPFWMVAGPPFSPQKCPGSEKLRANHLLLQRKCPVTW